MQRPARARITYPVEQAGAIAERELPFVVGVLADLSFQDDTSEAPVKDREFIDIDQTP